MGDLSEANALVVVPAGTTYVENGAPVQVLVLDRDF
jgi:molybdopterin biosynthesis enzyme